MSKSQEKRMKSQLKQGSKAWETQVRMAWTEKVISTTHIKKEDFYRIVASLAHLGEPLVQNGLSQIRRRGENILSLAHKLDVFFEHAENNSQFHDGSLVLELKYRKWEQQTEKLEEAEGRGEESGMDLAVAK